MGRESGTGWYWRDGCRLSRQNMTRDDACLGRRHGHLPGHFWGLGLGGMKSGLRRSVRGKLLLWGVLGLGEGAAAGPGCSLGFWGAWGREGVPVLGEYRGFDLRETIGG